MSLTPEPAAAAPPQAGLLLAVLDACRRLSGAHDAERLAQVLEEIASERPVPERAEFMALLAPHVALARESVRRSEHALQVELALRESELKYRGLYLNTPVMMHSIDQWGRLVSVSQAWLQTLGYTWEEVIGRASTDFLAPASRRYAREAVLPEFFRTGECKDIPYQFVRKDGTLVDVLLSAIAERDAEGRIMRSLAVLIDVTDQKRVEEERRDLLVRERLARAEADSARELERMRRQFLNTVSHELRTPLTSICGYAEFLEDEIGGPLAPQQAEFVAQIKQGAGRLSMLLDDLLDVARIEAGIFALRPQPVELGQKILAIAESLRPQLQSHCLTLEVSLPERPLVLVIDAERIGQVLLNLLSNAVKFTSPGGRIHLRVVSTGGAMRVEVVDSGEGIAPEEQIKLFRRFSQLESGIRQGGGTGLGLFISKAIVEAHGGTIGVESQPGNGATFWFMLPVHASGRP